MGGGSVRAVDGPFPKLSAQWAARIRVDCRWEDGGGRYCVFDCIRIYEWSVRFDAAGVSHRRCRIVVM